MRSINRRVLLVVLSVLLLACGETNTVDNTPETTGGDSSAGGTTATTPDEDATTGGATTADGETSADATTSGDTAGGSTTGADTTTTGDATTGADGCGDCSDQNECTKDVCTDGVCEHLPLDKPECLPLLEVTEPPRAAQLLHSDTVVVTGKKRVHFPAGKFTFNGVTIKNDDNEFSVEMFPDHGVNPITIELEDAQENRVKISQSFLMSEAYYDVTDGISESALVENGLVVYIGTSVFDDDDIGDVDDLATVAHLVLAGIDLMPLIPNPVTGESNSPGIGHCKWEVTVKDVTFKVGSVDIFPGIGGLTLAATITDLVVDFNAVAPGFACPDAGGTATSQTIQLSAFVQVFLKDGNQVGVVLDTDDVSVSVSPPDFELTSGAASWFDFLANWFDDQLAALVETAVHAVLVGEVAPIIKDLLESISQYQASFTISPLLGVTQQTDVTLHVQPSYIDFQSVGAIVGLAVGASTPKGASWLTSPGSIARSGCFDGDEPSLSISTQSPVAMGVHDDLLNQALFAAWWGGVINVSVDAELLKGLIPELPLENLEVQLDPNLPPVITSCTVDGTTQLQIGDLRLQAVFDFGGKPAAMEAWVSAGVEVVLDAKQAPGATIDISFGVQNVTWLEFQLTAVTGEIQGSDEALAKIINTVVVDVLLETLSTGVFKSFPVPAFDLSKLLPGIPEGTALGIVPEAVERQAGYTVLRGTIEDP